MRRRYDLVIAGAGIAGLSLAALLSVDRRYSILLVESDELAGGRFKVVERDGFLLDWGVHACLLGSRGAIGNALRHCGSRIRILPVGVAIHYRGKLRPFMGESLASVVSQKLLGPTDIAKLSGAVLTERTERSFRTGLEDWLSAHRASTRLSVALKGLCAGLLATEDYARASSGELFSFLRQALRRLSAGGYPDRGWEPVIDAFLDTARSSGSCDIELNANLQKVIATGKGVEGAVVEGEQIDALAVVCAFPPARFADDLIVEPPLDREYLYRLSKLEESVGICMEIALASPVTEDRRLLFAVEPPILAWAVSNVAPSVAPPGKQLLQLFSPINLDRRTDTAFIEERIDGMLDVTTEMVGADIEDEWRRVMVTTIGGVVPIVGQAFPDRPSIEVPGCPGLFLIGDGVASHGLGGDLAVRSAFDARPIIESYLVT